MTNTVSGSGKYRAIISRQHPPKDIHNASKWRSRLGDTHISSSQVRQARINLQSRYISSDSADILSRLKLGKTLFMNQLHNIGNVDTPFCKTCVRERNLETVETLTHATFECPYITTIIAEITNTFFPNKTSHTALRDIILATITNNHNIYEGKQGHTLASIIWDNFLVYILRCSSKGSTPLPVPMK